MALVHASLVYMFLKKHFFSLVFYEVEISMTYQEGMLLLGLFFIFHFLIYLFLLKYS